MKVSISDRRYKLLQEFYQLANSRPDIYDDGFSSVDELADFLLGVGLDEMMEIDTVDMKPQSRIIRIVTENATTDIPPGYEVISMRLKEIKNGTLQNEH